ncbi:MAG: UDP-N-acetylmuramate dehydrogenase [Patescibacteria group bacterium]
MQKNILLSEYTTLRVGGPARFFTSVKDVQGLSKAVSWAKEKKLPYLVIGGGSNILFVGDFPGLVIKMEMKGIIFESETVYENTVRVLASAGESWDDFVKMTVERGLWGLENLSYIPGTVGAAPIQNIGAYGRQVSDIIEYVEVFDKNEMTIKKISNYDCGFAYRTSIFKKPEGKRYIVIGISFLLSEKQNPMISHSDIKNFFSGKDSNLVSVKEIRTAIIEIRKSKLPGLKELGSAGSFFKNPVVDGAVLEGLKTKFPDIVYSKEKSLKYKLSAVYLIDHIGGWKGYRKGDAGVYDKHALVLVNHGRATSQEIFSLASQIQRDVYKKTRINLEFEVEIVKE